MASNSDIRRWLIIGILGSICLILAQYWVLQSREFSENNTIRNRELEKTDLSKRVPLQREPTPNDFEVRQGQDSVFINTPSEKLLSPFDLQSCIPDSQIFSKSVQTSFKIFIYDLPKKFNYDIVRCVQENDCFDLEYCGFGNELYKIDNISVRNTNQFSLEVVLHHQLLSSPYRVLDPMRADVLYVPAYMGLSCFCKTKKMNSTMDLVNQLYDWLEEQKHPYLKNRLMVSALAKIEREQASPRCPLLKFSQSKKITFATIEEESSTSTRRYLKINDQKVIPVPYPSYGHLTIDNKLEETIPKTSLEQRRVFIFLAAGPRRSNFFRGKVMDQFEDNSKTKLSYKNFYSIAGNQKKDMVLLYTQECRGDHAYTTIPWMQNSLFCLQPPGDSPTRKSFFDAVFAGCIPVIFTERIPVNYPFQRQVNYTQFTVMLSTYDIDKKGTPVRWLLAQITKDEIKHKLNAVRKVARHLQYSLPNGKYIESGAVQLFLDQIEVILKSRKTWNTHSNV